MDTPSLAIVVPCYNEQEVLPEAVKRLTALLDGMVLDERVSRSSRVWFVDDGSKDATWRLLRDAVDANPERVGAIKLSRNRGHQVALLAGLLTVGGDAVVSIDADLQDDVAIIPQMVSAFVEGNDVVYGVRGGRPADTFFKRLTAEGYYRLLERLGVEIVFNHADYRLMSRRAIESLRQYGETNVFLRGLVPQLGYPTTSINYTRQERFAGESKYPIRKMLALAWQGITSFSAVPLRVITAVGVLVSLVSLGLGFWALGVRLLTDDAVPGWASTVIPLFLLSGVQLLSLGIIGEYLAKVFIETKRRPLFFVEELLPGSPAQATVVTQDMFTVRG